MSLELEVDQQPTTSHISQMQRIPHKYSLVQLVSILDTVKLEIGNNKGVPFFDQYKRLTSTATPGSADITTSDKILTTNGATGVPVWTTTLDGAHTDNN